MIGDLADARFPIRNGDGTPSYRENQRETIIKILEAFQSGKKFVCLDGPVGCGKSAINYTVGMAIEGQTTYLTHQKQLQDQVVKELWPEVKMVKGRSAYCCNGATMNDDRIRCTYSGDRYETCRNSDKSMKKMMTYGGNQDEMLRQSIKRVMSKYSNNDRVFRMRTGFEPRDDINEVFDRIRRHQDNRSKEEEGYVPTSVFGSIGCSVKECECPVKSTRLLAQMYKVRILNPDVFYMLNRGQIQYFPHSSLMIIDECHKIENIIERIFGGFIHVGFLKKYFGVDLSELYECDDSKEFVEKYMYLMKTIVMPAKCAAAVMCHLAPVMGLSYLGGDQKFPTFTLNKSNLVHEFISCSRYIGKRRHEFNMLGFLKSVFEGECKDSTMGTVWNKCRDMFIELCAQNMCDTKFFGFDSMCISSDAQESMHRIAWFSEAISHLEDLVGLMSIPDSFMFSSKEANMWSEYENSEMDRFVKEAIPSYQDSYMMSVKLTPINIPGIMKSFFYDKADHIVLSTGTWVDIKGTMKTFGINKDSVEFVSIPTTFPVNRRPVYILRGGKYMDFSKKTEDRKGYLYKTSEGCAMFTGQVGELVNTLRGYFERNGGYNINILIHSFSFDIARRIAKFCPAVDDSWLIQIGKNDRIIRNEITGKSTQFIYKDELLQHLINHKNSGLTLVTASMAEGVDLKYDIARAQIILKRPTPSLGDPYVNSQYKGNPTFGIPKDPNFLDRATYTDMMQMYGRIMRAKDDWGVTVVYDQAIAKAFGYLLSSRGRQRVQELGLDYFVSAIKGGLDRNGFPYFDWPFD